MAIVSTKLVLEFLDVTYVTLNTWTKDPIFPEGCKIGTKKPVTWDTVKLLKYLVQREMSKNITSVSMNKRVDMSDETIDYAAEKARLTKAQADHEELKIAEKQKKAIPTDLVITEVTAAVTAAKAKLLGVVSKVRSRYPEMSDDIAIEVDEQIREALEELGSERELPVGLEKHLDEYLSSVESTTEADT